MASPNYPDPAGLVNEYLSLAANSYVRVASTAFVIYEYLITLDREVELFWSARSRSTGATVLFIVTRYWTLILRVLNMFGFMPMSNQRCAFATKALLAVTLLQYIPWALFAAFRGFALSRSRLLSALILLLSIATPTVNISLYHFGFTGYYDSGFGCTVVDPGMRLSLSRKLVIACRTCFMAADVLLIIITWTTVSRKEIRGLVSTSSGSTTSLAGILLRNGTWYFFVLLLLHGLHLTLSLSSIHVALQSLSYGYVTVFTEVFTAVLVSRFLLDLQEAHRKCTDGDFQRSGGFNESSPSHIETLVFRQSIRSPLTSTMDAEAETQYHEHHYGDDSDLRG